jgi:hypothetical protein
MDIANVVAALTEHRTRIDHAIAALEGVGSPGGAWPSIKSCRNHRTTHEHGSP